MCQHPNRCSFRESFSIAWCCTDGASSQLARVAKERLHFTEAPGAFHVETYFWEIHCSIAFLFFWGFHWPQSILSSNEFLKPQREH